MGFRVLVTGASAPTGCSMIQALQSEPVTVLACDVKGCAARGQDDLPAAARFVVHRSDDPEFVGDLVSLCLRHEVDVLVPTSEDEQLALAKVHTLFERFGTRVWLAPIPAQITRSQARRIVTLGERGRAKSKVDEWLRRSGLRARA